MTILVPYDGSEAADDMLRLACETASAGNGDDGRIVVLYVTRVPRALPLAPLPASVDAAGNDALNHAERVLYRYTGVVELRQARTRSRADAIVSTAEDIRADAIFLGLPSGRPWRRLWQALLAGAVIRRAPCRVFLGYAPTVYGWRTRSAGHEGATTGRSEGHTERWPA